MTEVVYVLIETTEDGSSVIGVFATLHLAMAEKYTTIREYFDIAEDECADEDLEAEVSDSVTYATVMREVIVR